MGHRIQNFEALAENELRTDALEIAEAGYAAINVGAALERKLRILNDELRSEGKTYSLLGRRIFFVGVGKCAFAAATALEELLGERLTGGIALAPLETPTGSRPGLSESLSLTGRDVSSSGKIEMFVGTHPLPSEVNEAATKRIIEFLAERRESDLVIMLISGGGSTLLCLHDAPMTCLDESTLFGELTAKGATIQDINTVRKHISLARGGALAKAAYPAEVVSLIVSDVPGNDIGFIASGPTVLDSSTVDDARAILAKYDITASANIEFLETPKEQKYFDRVANVLFLSSQDALAAMKDEAEKRGYATAIIDDHFDGEARGTGRVVVEKLHDVPAKTALLYAGESTVMMDTMCPSIPGSGGRNQEMALAALEYLNPDELIMPFASDGHDNTDFAGAISDETTRVHALAKNVSVEEYLNAHRSYDFFTATGDALRTGYTGSNVSDLIIALKK
ncbi:MAG: DUF4147 domain-containing protein [Candidatus Parcubacteria bacterium]|nr:DUF4147 domain-containing protein [Candidatus Parcubacteria bacterium]